MITKDQKADLITNAAIEAAAMLAMQQQQDNDSNVHPKYGCWSDEQKDCYLMGYRAASAEMEKLIEQREREAWDAAAAHVHSSINLDGYSEAWLTTSFEDWKKTQ